MACGYLQQCTAHDSIGWDNLVSKTTMAKVQEIAARLRLERDPAQGHWCVCNEGKAVLWVDASSLALGAAFKVDGDVVEDVAWLWSGKEAMHINLSELEAAI